MGIATEEQAEAIFEAIRRSDAEREAAMPTHQAAQHGVSAAYVCDVLQGRREPGDAICNGLGIVREIAYKHIV